MLFGAVWYCLLQFVCRCFRDARRGGVRAASGGVRAACGGGVCAACCSLRSVTTNCLALFGTVWHCFGTVLCCFRIWAEICVTHWRLALFWAFVLQWDDRAAIG